MKLYSPFPVCWNADIIEVGVPAHAPPQDDGVEGAFVDLLQERLPLHHPDLGVDPRLLEILLDDLGCTDALAVPLVRQDREVEGRPSFSRMPSPFTSFQPASRACALPGGS